MAHYTVFGTNPPSPMLGIYTDGTPSIETGGVFYLTDNNGPAIGWQCKGARVYIPNDPRVTGQPVVFRLRIGRTNNAALFGDPPEREITAVTPASGGWCEALWDTPALVDYGPDECFMVVSCAFTDPSAQAIYLYSNSLPTTAIPSVAIGTTLMYSESDADYPRSRRAKFRIGTDPGTPDSPGWYGVDVIMDEAPAADAVTPIAVYGFNEGSGTIAEDGTGNGHDLTTTSSNFTPSGHTAAGLQQLATNTVAVSDADGTFTAFPPAANAPYTVMFWGRYTAEGSAGPNWTVSQAIDELAMPHRAWGIAMSDGTNMVFRGRRGWQDTEITYPKLPLGEWHHYAMVYNQRGYLRGYVDGVLVGSNYNSIIDDVATVQALRIFGHSMQGQVIDDLRFFDYALAPNAVAYYMGQVITGGARSAKVKHWDGTEWQAHPLKMWDGVAWATHAVKGHNGTDFIQGKG